MTDRQFKIYIFYLPTDSPIVKFLQLFLLSVLTKCGSEEKTWIFEQGILSENTDLLITCGEKSGGNQEILWGWAGGGELIDSSWGKSCLDIDILPTIFPQFLCTAHCKERPPSLMWSEMY